MKKNPKNPLGTILRDSNIIREEDIGRALAEQKKSGLKFGEALVKLNIVQDDDVEWGLARQLGLPFLHLRNDDVDKKAVDAVPELVARRFGFVPYLLLEDRLTIVIDDPPQDVGKTEIENELGIPINVCLGLATEINSVLDDIYGSGETKKPSGQSKIHLNFLDDQKTMEVAKDPTGGILLRTLMDQMKSSGADSLHLEPLDNAYRLRFKELGGFCELGTIDRSWGLALTALIDSLIELNMDGSGGFLRIDTGKKQEGYHVLFMEASQGLFMTLVPMSPPRYISTISKANTNKKNRAELNTLSQSRSGLVLVTGIDTIRNLRLIELLLEKSDLADSKAVSIGKLGWFSGKYIPHIAVSDLKGEQAAKELKTAQSQMANLIVIEDLWGSHLVTAALEVASMGVRVYATLGFRSSIKAARYLMENCGSTSLVTSGLHSIVAQAAFPEIDPKQANEVELTRTVASGFGLEEYPKGKTVFAWKDHKPKPDLKKDRLLLEFLHINDETTEILEKYGTYSEVRKALSETNFQDLKSRAQELVLNGTIAADDFAAAFLR